MLTNFFSASTFRDNLVSVEIRPAGFSGGYVSTLANTISGCTFTAGNNFKTSATGPHMWAKTHLNVGNFDVRTWAIANCSFQGAFVGIYGGIRAPYAGEDHLRNGLTLTGSTFTNCLLGGVLSTLGWKGSIHNANTFQLPTAYPATTAQLTGFLTSYHIPDWLHNQPVGIYGYTGNELTVNNNTFAGTAGPGATLASLGDLNGSPTGIFAYAYSNSLIATNNTFSGLGAGIHVPGQNSNSILGNSFLNCRNGVRVRLWNPDFTSDGSPNALLVSCNDFQRTAPNGFSAGIYISEGVNVQFAEWNQQGTVSNDLMKNRFLPFSGANHFYLYSAPANTYLTSYKTFSDATQTNAGLMLAHVSGNVAVSQGIPFNSDLACSRQGYPATGVQQRPAADGGVSASEPGQRLAAPTPNPANEQATFTYRLPAGATGGELVLREALGGRVVLRQPLTADHSQITVPLAHLPVGLYLATLVGPGRAGASVRLQVTR